MYLLLDSHQYLCGLCVWIQDLTPQGLECADAPPRAGLSCCHPGTLFTGRTPADNLLSPTYPLPPPSHDAETCPRPSSRSSCACWRPSCTVRSPACCGRALRIHIPSSPSGCSSARTCTLSSAGASGASWTGRQLGLRPNPVNGAATAASFAGHLE